MNALLCMPETPWFIIVCAGVVLFCIGVVCGILVARDDDSDHF